MQESSSLYLVETKHTQTKTFLSWSAEKYSQHREYLCSVKNYFQITVQKLIFLIKNPTFIQVYSLDTEQFSMYRNIKHTV